MTRSREIPRDFSPINANAAPVSFQSINLTELNFKNISLVKTSYYTSIEELKLHTSMKNFDNIEPFGVFNNLKD